MSYMRSQFERVSGVQNQIHARSSHNSDNGMSRLFSPVICRPNSETPFGHVSPRSERFSEDFRPEASLPDLRHSLFSTETSSTGTSDWYPGSGRRDLFVEAMGTRQQVDMVGDGFNQMFVVSNYLDESSSAM